jgi:hypothetical protein
MNKKATYQIILILFFSTLASSVMAQVNRQLESSQQFRLAERIVRIAEPGEFADTLNVWGDINSPGRYLIPQTTSLPELISYSFGPATIRSNETSLDWSKLRLEIKVSRFNAANRQVNVETFKYKYDEPEPADMFDYDLQNNDIVTLQVKRKPAFIDYVRVIAPVISSVAAGFLIIERLR